MSLLLIFDLHMKIKQNGNYLWHDGEFYRFYLEDDDKRYIIQGDFHGCLLEKGFSRYQLPELKYKVFKIINKEDIVNAFKISTFCNYDGGKYLVRFFDKEKVILAPDTNTLVNVLGRHPYDDGIFTIEISYNKFLEAADDVWEERKEIDGLKFDTNPVYYLRKKNR